MLFWRYASTFVPIRSHRNKVMPTDQYLMYRCMSVVMSASLIQLSRRQMIGRRIFPHIGPVFSRGWHGHKNVRAIISCMMLA